MEIEVNPYEGINYYPDADADRRYGAVIGTGKGARFVGFYGSLQQAIEARTFALNARNVRTRNYEKAIIL